MDSWRKIAIALTDTDFGEQKAQSGENALFHQLPDGKARTFA
jgi:hypothetical protein